MNINDLWMLVYLMALHKDKLNPSYEAELACIAYADWANDVDQETEE